ncbi:MAG: hypothetical protein ACEQSX_12695 [Baekduiaceae bacterium]
MDLLPAALALGLPDDLDLAGDPEVKLQKAKKNPRKVSYAGKLISPELDFGITGKVEVVWQAKRKGGWKKIHGGTKNANKAFTFNQQLKFKGKWRVRAIFKGKKPYKNSQTKWTQFTVPK